MYNHSEKRAVHRPVYGGGYTKEELRSMLPKVGERRVENGASSDVIQLTSKKPGICTVVEVHEEHFWYRVRFDSNGACQCFKLPRLGIQIS